MADPDPSICAEVLRLLAARGISSESAWSVFSGCIARLETPPPAPSAEESVGGVSTAAECGVYVVGPAAPDPATAEALAPDPATAEALAPDPATAPLPPQRRQLPKPDDGVSDAADGRDPEAWSGSSWDGAEIVSRKKARVEAPERKEDMERKLDERRDAERSEALERENAELRRQLDDNRARYLEAIARPLETEYSAQPDARAVFREVFSHGYAPLPCPVLLYDTSEEARLSGLTEPRKTFPFFSPGDRLLTLEGRVVEVSAEEHPFLLRPVDNTVAKVPRALEPAARLLYGMLLMSNHKVLPWERRRHAAPGDDDWEACGALSRPPDYRMNVCAMMCQEGKTLTGLCFQYLGYALEGLCPVTVTQLRGGRSCRAKDWCSSVERFCSWESSGDPNHITVRQCFETLMNWAKESGQELLYPELMTRFFLAARELSAKDVVKTMRQANYTYTVYVVVPSPQSLRCMRDEVLGVVGQYGKKDGKYRVSLLWDEIHETLNGCTDKGPRQHLEYLVDNCARLDSLTATPLNAINFLRGCNVLSRARHSDTYYGFGESVHPSRRVSVNSWSDDDIKGWDDRLPRSGESFLGAAEVSVHVRNLLRRAVLDMVARPDKHLPGWRHLKLDVNQANHAQSTALAVAGVEELGVFGLDWMSDGTRTDLDLFSGSSKSATRIYVPSLLADRFRAMVGLEVEGRLGECSAWEKATLSVAGRRKTAEVAELSEYADLAVDRLEPPLGRVLVVNLPGMGLNCALDVMEAVWRHPARDFPVLVVSATGPTNTSGVVNKSSSHGTMLTDEVAVSMLVAGNPLHTTAVASNKFQKSGRLAGQFPLVTPAAPPTLWCNDVHETLVERMGRLTSEFTELSTRTSRLPGGGRTLLEALVRHRVYISQASYPGLRACVFAARAHARAVVAAGRDPRRLSCNLITSNAAETAAHFSLILSLNTDAPPIHAPPIHAAAVPEAAAAVPAAAAADGLRVNFGGPYNREERWLYDPDDVGEPDTEASTAVHRPRGDFDAKTLTKIAGAVRAFYHGRDPGRSEVPCMHQYLEYLQSRGLVDRETDSPEAFRKKLEGTRLTKHQYEALETGLLASVARPPYLLLPCVVGGEQMFALPAAVQETVRTMKLASRAQAERMPAARRPGGRIGEEDGALSSWCDWLARENGGARSAVTNGFYIRQVKRAMEMNGLTFEQLADRLDRPSDFRAIADRADDHQQRTALRAVLRFAAARRG
jgi:hypothetical protein